MITARRRQQNAQVSRADLRVLKGWRWRESNPRPNQLQDRASPGGACAALFSAPAITQARSPTGSATVKFPDLPRGRVSEASFLAEARNRVEKQPRADRFF